MASKKKNKIIPFETLDNEAPIDSPITNECSICMGYGLWAVGDPCPMGPMDYADGCPNKKCPECGRGGTK